MLVYRSYRSDWVVFVYFYSSFKLFWQCGIVVLLLDCYTALTLNSHCLVPCKSQHATCVLRIVEFLSNTFCHNSRELLQVVLDVQGTQTYLYDLFQTWVWAFRKIFAWFLTSLPRRVSLLGMDLLTRSYHIISPPYYSRCSCCS